MIFRRRSQSLDAAFFVLVVAVFSSVSRGAEPASDHKPAPEKSAAKPARKNFKLPGLAINFQKRCVDIEATICLDEGMLELIACTKGSKEHESIVVTEARPMHVHTALLLLGAKNGNPAMRRPIDEQQTRWSNFPPRGDPVGVYLVFDNANGKQVEHPISDFVARAERPGDNGEVDEKVAEEDARFPNTFLFAGSVLHGDGPGPRRYLADHSGNVISIVTFGDELLCLPAVYGHGNDSLMWQVDAAKLPKVGSKVTLRLRPRNKPPAKTDQAEKQQPNNGSQKNQE
ncbi:MAG: hypothetical protein HQ581_20510 [Planctomycetes bacterium]|nr:hypothetical protein [Planctomycetota bacterium]